MKLKETQDELIDKVNRLAILTSFKHADILDIKNLYLKYINNKAIICTSCPGNLRFYIKNFQNQAESIINKIKDE